MNQGNVEERNHDDIAVVTAALELLFRKYPERIAELRRNEILPMLSAMNDTEFSEFEALDVPALMAWCACNALPADASFGARQMRSRLTSHDSLELFVRTAVNGVLSRTALRRVAEPGYRARNYAGDVKTFDRLHSFITQLERTGAFAPGISRAALGLTGIPSTEAE